MIQHTKYLLILLCATLGFSVQAQSFTDRARVRAVVPQYDAAQYPHQECANSWIAEPSRTSSSTFGGYGGAVIGGVTGGVLGRQVGRGRGRDLATVAGSVIGALAGARIEAHQEPYYTHAPYEHEVRSCHTVYEQQTRLTGYRVTYEYRGLEYSTLTREQPGTSIPVRVTVTPLDGDFIR